MEEQQNSSAREVFGALGLTDATLEGVLEVGYESPTPIQAQAIPALLSGVDVIAQAQTGSGKTAAFVLPMIERLNPDFGGVQALVLCPTRELAVQVAEAAYSLGRKRGFQVVPIYGGQPIDRQIRSLRRGAQIVVGTPGRVQDHLRRGTLDLSGISMVVLDEADEMLAMGFVEDVELILSELPEERQIGLFSATMPPPIVRLAQKFLKNPTRITIESKAQNVPQIRQSYYELMPSQKVDGLTRILDMETPGPTIIFCNTKRETDEVAEQLRARGYQAESLHGDMNQSERDRVMRRFRSGQVDLLVATDVAARGIDIETVTHVINYDVPWDVEVYTHRIGRTGRAGREGDAITLIHPRERRQLKLIERLTGARIQPVRLPTTADIAARRRELFKQSLVDALEASEFDDFLITVGELSENYDASEVAAAALKLLWVQQQGDVSPQVQLVEEQRDGTRAEPGMARLFVNVGRQDGLRPTDLVGAIANEAGIPGKSIGAIDILDRHAFVEVPEDSADRVVEALSYTRLRGRRVRAERATGEAPPAGTLETPSRRPERPYKGKGSGKGPGKGGHGYRPVEVRAGSRRRSSKA